VEFPFPAAGAAPCSTSPDFGGTEPAECFDAMSGGGIFKEKTGYAKRRFKDIVNILPGHASFGIYRRTIMKRKAFLAGVVGTLLLLGMVFAAAGCDTGSSEREYRYTFINNSSYSVTIRAAGLAVCTIASGTTKTVQLAVSDIDLLTFSSSGNVKGSYTGSALAGYTVTFYNK
jgi:hypothetical protein